MNQNKFTTLHTVLPGFISKDVWRAVAVTLEKNVAIVVMLRYRVVSLSFSSVRNIGSAKKSSILLYWNTQRQHNSPFSPNLCSSPATACIAFSEPGSRISFVYLIDSRYWSRFQNRPVYKHCKWRSDTVWAMNPPIITKASYTCTVRQYVILICRNLPDWIHATREPCENRKRVSVRRANLGRLQWPCSYPCRWHQCCMSNHPALRAKLNGYTNPSKKMTSYTGIIVEILKLYVFSVRVAHASDLFSKSFRRSHHRVATTHATIVFFQMVKLLRPTVSDYLHRQKKYYFFHKRQTFPSRARCFITQE